MKFLAISAVLLLLLSYSWSLEDLTQPQKNVNNRVGSRIRSWHIFLYCEPTLSQSGWLVVVTLERDYLLVAIHHKLHVPFKSVSLLSFHLRF